MKRIVILCDGTWNRADSATPTNVVRLAQLIEPVSATGIVQATVYIQGVGTGAGSTKFNQWTDKILGGAFGKGLLENIVTAYQQLVFLYNPGDEIFICGFSRGAYTARSLTGFIRSTGMIDRANLNLIPAAVARYRDRAKSTHPGTEASHAYRARVSPRVATSAKEAAWRADKNLPASHLLKIAYLGVWDSVGALGVPKSLSIAGLINGRKYDFHDADLSSMVASARHAVALDERRPTFTPTRWTNLDALNAESEVSPAPYREEFLLGDHGSVGGGGDITQLSAIGLRWIAEGAQEAGLELNARALSAIQAEENPTGPLHNRTQPSGGIGAWITTRNAKDREGPSKLSELHDTVFTRWTFETKDRNFKPYRPGSLNRVNQQLVAWNDQRIAGSTRIT